MTKRKQKNKKKLFLSQRILTIIALILLSTMLVGVIYLTQKPKNETKMQQSPSNSESLKDSLSNPAVAEAKSVADEYSEAAKNCDLEKANSLRLLPKTTTKTKEECQKECPGGLRYKFLKPITYNSKESGGIVTEVAAFDYAASCSDKTTPLLVQMIRSSDDNKWQVFGTM